jgi:hypothetical protein
MTNRRHLGVLALLALLPGCASMRDLYRTEVRTERSAHPPDTQKLLAEGAWGARRRRVMSSASTAHRGSGRSISQ